MSSRSTREDPYNPPIGRRRTVAASPAEDANALPLERGLHGQRWDGHLGEGSISSARVGRSSTVSTASTASSRAKVSKVQQTAILHDTPPRPREVDPFPTIGARAGKSKTVVPISMAQRSAWQDAHAIPQTPAKSRPGTARPRLSTSVSGNHYLPTPTGSSNEGRRYSPAPSASGTGLPTPNTPTSARASHASSSRSANARVVKQEPMAVNANTTSLTPPPSDRIKRPSRSNARRPVVEEDEHAGGGYLPSPIKTPWSGQHSASSSGHSFPWPQKHELKQEERLPAPDFTGSASRLITPESSPLQQKNAHLRLTPIPRVISGGIFLKEYPSRRPPPLPKPKAIFRTIAPYGCTIQSMPLEVIIANGEPFLTYKCKNGHTLRWFQAQDFEVLVSEAVSREVMKLDGDDNWVNVAQGKILHYQMGLGKTHVACLVVVEVLQQLKSVYAERGLQLHAKPVLVIADKLLQPQWKKHFSDLAGASLNVTVYEKGNTAMPKADVIICNIVMFRNQYDRYLQHWEMQEEAYLRNPIGIRPDRSKPTENDRLVLSISAPFFVDTFQYVVIDEFHSCIANAHTTSSRSVLAVKANHFLLVSGTPAQNRLDDLNVPFALLLHPSRRKNFSEAEAINRRVNKGLESKRKRDMRNSDVVDKIETNDTLIAQTTITRLNNSDIPGEEPLVHLPCRTDYLVMANLTEEERLLYDHVEDNTFRFVKLMRTRQAPLHPNLVRKAFQRLHGYCADGEPEDGADLEGLGEDVTDEFKMDVDEISLLDIQLHGLDDTKPTGSKKCSDALPPQAAAMRVDEIMDDDYLSSRFRIVLGILGAIWRERPVEKVIIFSSFTSLLQLLEHCLDQSDIAHIKYTGTMSSNERQQALQTITEDARVKVILVSMKAGGVGLNITAVNNVIVLDPCWNPYVEEQAVSRVHRQGQTRDVYVFRIISPNTIETRIKEIQDEKREVVDGYTRRCVGVMRGKSVQVGTRTVATERAF